MVTRGPSGKDLGCYGERGWWTLAPQLWYGLNPHSVCNKSPNVLAALLPLLDLNLKQCWRWVQPCAEKGGLPGMIRPEKECIKSCETCFANTLNLNNKGPSLNEMSLFPKVLWPFSYLTLTLNKPSEFFEFIYLIITAWQWLMSFPYMPCIPMQIKPIKACQGKGQGTLPSREWPCCPFSSTGLGSWCEFVSSTMPQTLLAGDRVRLKQQFSTGVLQEF